MPWERLQQGPEEPLTDDADVLLNDGPSSRQYGRPWMEYFSGQGLLRSCSTSRRRYFWSMLLLTNLLILSLIPIILYVQHRGQGPPPGPLASVDTTTPFIEPFDFVNSSETPSIKSFSPPEYSPVLDFLYEYLSLMASADDSNSSSATNITSKKIQVTIYYESLSIPSRLFLAHQFFPTYFATQRQNLSATLVPFGHAHFVPGDVKGIEEKLKCEHQQDECQGNLVQACAIRHTNWNDTASVETLMKFIRCLMADTGKGGNILNTAAESTGVTCAKMERVDWDAIYNCTVSREGIMVLKTFQQKTDWVLRLGGQNLTNQFPLPVVLVKGHGVLSEEEKNDFPNFIQSRLGVVTGP